MPPEEKEESFYFFMTHDISAENLTEIKKQADFLGIKNQILLLKAHEDSLINGPKGDSKDITSEHIKSFIKNIGPIFKNLSEISDREKIKIFTIFWLF